MTKKALEQEGYEIVDFKIEEYEFGIGRKVIMGLAGAYFVRLMKLWTNKTGEVLTINNLINLTLIDLPLWFRKALAGIFKKVGFRRVAKIIEVLKITDDYFEFENLLR